MSYIATGAATLVTPEQVRALGLARYVGTQVSLGKNPDDVWAALAKSISSRTAVPSGHPCYAPGIANMCTLTDLEAARAAYATMYPTAASPAAAIAKLGVLGLLAAGAVAFLLLKGPSK